MISVKKGTTWTQKLRIASPILASTTTIVTLITCVVISRVNEFYVGGLKWPYFSDMGRDAPAYYVFCAGLTIIGIFLSMTWFFNYQYQRGALQRCLQLGHVSSSIKYLCVSVLLFGIISTIGLPLLSFFDTASYPSLHVYSAYWFFYWETLAVFINTLISYKIYQGRQKLHETSFLGIENLQQQQQHQHQQEQNIIHDQDTKKNYTKRFQVMKRTFLIQILSIPECLEKKLGTKYCLQTMRLNEKETKLWNYEKDIGWTQMRAGAQLGCILTLIGYSISFLSHDYDLQDYEDLEEEQQQTTPFPPPTV